MEEKVLLKAESKSGFMFSVIFMVVAFVLAIVNTVVFANAGILNAWLVILLVLAYLTNVIGLFLLGKADAASSLSFVTAGIWFLFYLCTCGNAIAVYSLANVALLVVAGFRLLSKEYITVTEKTVAFNWFDGKVRMAFPVQKITKVGYGLLGRVTVGTPSAPCGTYTFYLAGGKKTADAIEAVVNK